MQALPARSFERAELFATCSGRLAALATRQRGLNDEAANTSARLSDEFDLLLDATLPFAVADGMPHDQGRIWWSRGWSEVAALLSDMDHSFDTGLSDRARKAVDDRIRACTAVLIGADGT